MTKSKLIICLLISLLFLSYTICYATSDIDMNLLSNSLSNTNANINNTNSNTNTSNTYVENENIFEDEPSETYTPSASVSSTTYSDGADELTIGDMINICLIVVGVLLILLSIAILIRLKN